MIGILGKILGSGDVIKKGMDLIDDMHTSSEEEIAAKPKAPNTCLLYTSPSPRDGLLSRMPSSA